MSNKKPNKKSEKEAKPFIDRIIYAVAIIEPLFVMPQVIQIFRDKDATGISILTWTGLTVLTGIWVWWAAVHKEKVIFVYQALFMIFNTLVIGGAILYGGKWY